MNRPFCIDFLKLFFSLLVLAVNFYQLSIEFVHLGSNKVFILFFEINFIQYFHKFPLETAQRYLSGHLLVTFLNLLDGFIISLINFLKKSFLKIFLILDEGGDPSE